MGSQADLSSHFSSPFPVDIPYQLQDVCLEQRVQESEQRTPEVTQIAHSPATSILAAGYANGCIRTWDTTDGACLAVLQSHTGSVSALAYNSSGGLVASGSQDTDIIVWDVAGEVGLYKLKAHTNQVTAVAFLDKQNKLLSSGKDGFVRVWDLSVQFCIQVVPIHAGMPPRVTRTLLCIPRGGSYH